MFPRISHRIAAAVTTVLLISNVAAAPEARFQPAYAEFMRASKDPAAIDKASDAFAALLQAEPDNPVLMAYAGAALSMKARSTMLPWKKMSYAEDGMAMLDKALALLTPAHDAVMQHGTPGALEVRLVAANTFLAVPSFMNRSARGMKLLGEVLSSPLLASAPLGFQGGAWMRAATQAAKDNRIDDARRYYNEVVQHKAPQAAMASEKLQELTK